jgi:predicted  nucleic acid-binding Zn-ribbon protein
VQQEGVTIQSTLDDIQGKMKTLESEREKLVKECDPSLVSRYEKIRKQRGGIAVVQVVGGTCKGCQRNIPPQMANNLITAREVMTCPNCHRFIYAAETPEQTASA